MSDDRDNPLARASNAEVGAFLSKVAATPRPRNDPASGGRLLFAMDATASREPTWDQACHVQSAMFEEAAALGGLNVQLCFYRGYSEFKKTTWLNNARALQGAMSKVRCLGGLTQIGRVLEYAASEHRAAKLNALVFVGDVVEENVDQLCHQAAELGMQGVRVFTFHEGPDPRARQAFEQLAKLSGGACCPFDLSSPEQLRMLLRAVAAYAAGGRAALTDFENRAGAAVPRLSRQVK